MCFLFNVSLRLAALEVIISTLHNRIKSRCPSQSKSVSLPAKRSKTSLKQESNSNLDCVPRTAVVAMWDGGVGRRRGSQFQLWPSGASSYNMTSTLPPVNRRTGTMKISFQQNDQKLLFLKISFNSKIVYSWMYILEYVVDKTIPIMHLFPTMPHKVSKLMHCVYIHWSRETWNRNENWHLYTRRTRLIRSHPSLFLRMKWEF